MKIVVSGKRKTSIAKAILTEGDGRVFINKKDYKLLPFFDKFKIEEPLRIAEKILGKNKINFDASIMIQGGGEKGQIDAARLALAKAIIQFSNSKELREAYLDYDRSLLVADVRRKETCKPGDSKARAKRQTSYR
jgi:small subunit ribosomal protein S9